MAYRVARWQIEGFIMPGLLQKPGTSTRPRGENVTP
jgi:hypothetical protein